jgi:hypothetical protein
MGQALVVLTLCGERSRGVAQTRGTVFFAVGDRDQGVLLAPLVFRQYLLELVKIYIELVGTFEKRGWLGIECLKYKALLIILPNKTSFVSEVGLRYLEYLPNIVSISKN